MISLRLAASTLFQQQNVGGSQGLDQRTEWGVSQNLILESSCQERRETVNEQTQTQTDKQRKKEVCWWTAPTVSGFVVYLVLPAGVKHILVTQDIISMDVTAGVGFKDSVKVKLNDNDGMYYIHDSTQMKQDEIIW